MENVPWTWKLINDHNNGTVDAVIYSIDGKSQLSVKNMPGQLVDGITSILTTSYKWGFEDAMASLPKSEQTIADETTLFPPVAEAPLPGRSVEDWEKQFEEFKAKQAEAAKTIANLKGQITKLKNRDGDNQSTSSEP